MNKTAGKLIKIVLCAILLTGIFAFSTRKAEALDYDLELNLYDSDDYGELTFSDFTTAKIVKLIIKYGEGSLSNDELNRISHGFSLFSEHLEWEGDYCYQYIKVSPYYGGTDTVELIPPQSEKKATLKLTAPMKVKFNPNGGVFADQSAVGEDKEITFTFPINSSTTLPYIPEVSWEKHEFKGWYDLDGNEVKADTVFTVGNHIYARWTIDLDITKVWDDGDDYEGIRPESVEIALCIRGDEIDRITLSIENEWKGAFENVPVFEDEKEIDYTVKEIETDVLNGNNVEGSYSVAITGNMNDGFIITNIHKTETTPSYEIPKTGIE